MFRLTYHSCGQAQGARPVSTAVTAPACRQPPLAFHRCSSRASILVKHVAHGACMHRQAGGRVRWLGPPPPALQRAARGGAPIQPSGGPALHKRRGQHGSCRAQQPGLEKEGHYRNCPAPCTAPCAARDGETEPPPPRGCRHFPAAANSWQASEGTSEGSGELCLRLRNLFMPSRPLERSVLDSHACMSLAWMLQGLRWSRTWARIAHGGRSLCMHGAALCQRRRCRAPGRHESAGIMLQFAYGSSSRLASGAISMVGSASWAHVSCS